MIEIHPMKDKAREKELLSKIPEKESNAKVLLMTDGGEDSGYVAVDIKEDKLRMLEFSLLSDINDEAEKSFLLDTLMRSAASYGEENGADFLETVSPEMNAFLKVRGFDTDSEHAFTPMSTIVHYDY